MQIIPAKRVSRTYTQKLIGSTEMVFPLLCPVREADWIQGWDPLLVVSASGVAERDCAFVTASLPSNSIWYVTCHEPSNGFVEMIKLTPGVTVCRLTIQLRGVVGGSEADVTYCHTSLSAEGDEFVASFTDDHYLKFMQYWEASLNHYLRYGSALLETEA
jgi:hypothetical protein